MEGGHQQDYKAGDMSVYYRYYFLKVNSRFMNNTKSLLSTLDNTYFLFLLPSLVSLQWLLSPPVSLYSLMSQTNLYLRKPLLRFLSLSGLFSRMPTLVQSSSLQLFSSNWLCTLTINKKDTTQSRSYSTARK